MSIKIMKSNTAPNRRLTVRKIAPLCVLVALVFGGNSRAIAGCWFDTGTTLPMRLSLPASLVVQRDAPPGTVIWSSEQSTRTGEIMIWCGYGSYTEATRYISAQSLVAGYSDVYQSNIPGIGFRVRNPGFRLQWDPVPTTQNYTPPGIVYGYGPNQVPFKMELIYVGGNANGQLSFASPLASLTTGEITASQLYIDGGTSITKVACSLNSTSINVPLGDVLDIKFTAIGTTVGDKNFDVGLTCDKEARINVALAGTQNSDTTDTSVLALTNTGQAGTAGGMGVQLLYGGTPLKINNNIVLKTSPGGQETLPFTARYYQTNKVVTPGKANSSATLNITYQ